MDFQKYNIKVKKKKAGGTRKQNKTKQKTKPQELLKTTPTTTQRLYMVFALKNSLFFWKVIVGYRNKN